MCTLRSSEVTLIFGVGDEIAGVASEQFIYIHIFTIIIIIYKKIIIYIIIPKIK